MPSISLKLIVGVQWMLVMWAIGWPSNLTYQWTNVTVVAVGVWAIADRQSADAVFMYMVTIFISSIIDIVLLALYYEYSKTSDYRKFCVGMAITNLILKPFVILLLYQMYQDRGGGYGLNFGGGSTLYGNEEGSNVGTHGNIVNPNAQAYNGGGSNAPTYDYIGDGAGMPANAEHGSTVYQNTG